LIGFEQNRLDEDFFSLYFSKVQHKKIDLTFKNYPANAGGENKLYVALVKEMGLA
jgi:hypothetical protein